MRRSITAIALVVLGLLALAGTASARTGATETISTTLPLPSFPSGPPWTETYYGTFAAAPAPADGGSVTADAIFGAVAAPSTGQFETFRYYTSPDGTLVLHCSQHASDFSDLTAVPDTGRCAVLSASGAYSGLYGSGPIVGVANLVVGLISDVVQLPTR